MPSEVRRDLDASKSAFEALVWPAIAPLCGGGDLVHLEGSSHRTDRDLDTLAGIDGYQRITARGMRGIASRVQPVSRPWDTFTIRLARKNGSATEYAKRLAAITEANGWLYAHITVQAYITKDRRELLAAAAVRTSDLMHHAERCRAEHGWSQRNEGGCYKDETGNAIFLVVPWAHLVADGILVKRTTSDISW
jgi:hypothetical protein